MLNVPVWILTCILLVSAFVDPTVSMGRELIDLYVLDASIVAAYSCCRERLWEAPATLPDDGLTGGFFRVKEPIPW